MLSIFKKKKQEPRVPSTMMESEAPVMQEETIPVDMNEGDFPELFRLCRPFTMTSVERLYSLYRAMHYVIKNKIPGDFIECGVWKGGSSLMMAKMLTMHGITDRKVILYDTYEGMSEPTENDKDYSGVDAEKLLEQSSIEVQDSVWCYSSFDEVKSNLTLSGLPEENIIMIKGKVEDTIPSQVPTEKIALLRLDTDWYESTKHELEHLYPMLVKDGLLIIDDYGHWQGCRKAVDEYMSKNDLPILLCRIDNTGRIAVKL